jgi:GxxExxY protein
MDGLAAQHRLEESMQYEELTRAVIGCAMKVHATLGNGFQEVIYQRCLEIELKKADIEFAREQTMPIFYDGHEVGSRRADFIIAHKVLVELKAIIDLEDVHLAQGLNYLEAYCLEVGLLINFGSRSLQFKRLLNRRIKAAHNSSKSSPSLNPDSGNFSGASR